MEDLTLGTSIGVINIYFDGALVRPSYGLAEILGKSWTRYTNSQENGSQKFFFLAAKDFEG